MGWLIVLHIFGVIFWIGALLLATSLLARLPEEAKSGGGAATVAGARRMLSASGGAGAAVTIVCGILLILADPALMRDGWLHVKLLLVLILIAIHALLHRRIKKLEQDPSGATRGEFMAYHGLVSLLVLAILILVVIRPF